MKTKICSKCKKEQAISEFHKDKTTKDGLYSNCKECKSKYTTQRYRIHKERLNKETLRRRQKQREWLNQYKLEKGCEVCGYDKCSRALVFHHRNSDEKDFTLANFTHRGKKKILEEIEKCQVLCANCHLELHDKLRKEINNESD